MHAYCKCSRCLSEATKQTLKPLMVTEQLMKRHNSRLTSGALISRDNAEKSIDPPTGNELQ